MCVNVKAEHAYNKTHFKSLNEENGVWGRGKTPKAEEPRFERDLNSPTPS